MNKQQSDYIREHCRKKSVGQLAGELKLDRKEVQREVRRVLAAGKPAEAAPAGPVKTAEGSGQFRPKKWMHVLAALLVMAFVFVLFSGALSFPFMNWDDPQYVTENPAIRSLSPVNIKAMFFGSYVSIYVPLTILSYAIDYQFSHFDPAGYHLTNVLIHVLSTGLVYALVLLVTGEWLAALGAALLFGIHPVQIESVVWIAERKNVLSSLFFLAAFLSYALSRLRPRRGVLWLTLSAILFVLACLSKPNTVVLPLLLVAFDFSRGLIKKEFPYGGGRYLFFFAGAVVFGLITALIVRGEGKMNYYGGSFGATMVTMMVVMMRYFEILLCPIRQSLLYEFPPYPSVAHPHVALSFFALLVIFAGLAWLAFRRRQTFFWAAWYFIVLLPMLNLIPFPSLMNDRYLYLPLIGFFVFVLLLLIEFAGRKATAAAVFLAVFGFAFLNVKRQAVWSKPENLWLETQSRVETRHQSPYINLGMHYLRQGDTEQAIAQFEKVLTFTQDPKAYDGLGIAYFKRGDLAKSVEYFNRALALAPKAASIHSNLAIVYKEQQNFEGAFAEFREAVEAEPRSPKFRNNLGSVLMELGRNEEAEKEFREVFDIDPDFADGLY
ncbi:MAG: tetratricopeptide repeat protein, partial [Candidatus Omnitrophica bacterium]|nr:tetratricopeptide repeat protein [Candidatus Omnitrophota bacterium]